MCGVIFFAGALIVSTVAGSIAAASNNARWPASLFVLGVLVFLIYRSIQDPRFGKCLLKGLLVNVVVFAILAGTCIAILNSAYG